MPNGLYPLLGLLVQVKVLYGSEKMTANFSFYRKQWIYITPGYDFML